MTLPPPARRPRGVGRARELEIGARALQDALRGQGRALAVTGVPGAGKTWLCEALAELAAADGFRVGWGSGWSAGDAPPLWPWRQALTALGAVPDGLLDALPEIDGPEWFAACSALVEHLGAATHDHPALLVIDDAHAADAMTARLAQFVARHGRALHLVVVVAHRPVRELEDLDRDVAEIALHGLDTDDVAALFAASGVDELSAMDAEFLAIGTGGLPMEVRRLASRSGRNIGVVRWLIEQRIAALPPAIAHSAACAAVLEHSPRLRDIATITVDDDVHAQSVAHELERLGLATRIAPDRLAFTHDEVRAALQAALEADEVVDLHARAAAIVDDGPPSVERLRRRAEHALAALHRSPDDARLAVSITHDAAAALVSANDPDGAVALLAACEAGYEAMGLGRPPAAFLNAHAEALLRGGRLAIANERYGQAALAAEEDGDAASFAVAALGMGGVWLAEQRSTIERQRVLGTQQRARDQLPAEQRALRLRLDVRLAAEHAYETGDFGAIERSVDEARAFGDATALAEALSHYHHTLLGPEHREIRSAIAQEMIAIAATMHDPSLSLMAALWWTTDLFLDGNPQAERVLGDLRARADASGGKHAAYIASVMDVMLLERAGRLDDAERAANVAFEVGVEVGDADAVAYYGSQIVVLRWIQGRSGEVLELAARTAASPTITPANHAFTGVFASLAAECGEHDRARAALTRVRGRLATIPQNSAWLATLFTIVEAAHHLGDAELARECTELLAPYADLPVMGSLAVVCLGSARRSLGLAALTVGALDEGIALLEAAVADDERLGNRPVAAITVADLARAHMRRARPGDRDVALALFERATREATAMGLTVRAEQWRDERDAVTRPTAPVAAPGAIAGDEGTIERHGPSWVMTVATTQIVIPDLIGMTYLAQLLTNPGAEIPAAALVIDAGDPAVAVAERDEQPVLDASALAAYRRRRSDLEQELAAADAFGDVERSAQARREMDALVQELSRVTNRFGRTRAFASSNERARTAVQKAVRRVLDHVESVDVELGSALRRSVRTGRTCCYQPGPGVPARWRAAG